MKTKDAPSTDDEILERLLRNRHSCRGFLADQVPRQCIERLLEIAQRTPSWCNTQPWHLLVTSGRAIERLADELTADAEISDARQSELAWPSEYQGASLDRRRECGFALYDSVGIPKGDRAGANRQALQNFRFFGAPHVAIITTDRALGPYGAVDCGAYVATFLLAAESLGIAAVPQAALAGKSPVLRRFFDIPDDRMIVCGISFGYEDRAHPANGFRTSRAGLDAVAEWVDE